jgi:hypothetical protein
MHLGAGDVELLPSRASDALGDLPLARRQLLRLRRGIGDVERVEVHPAVALREEPHALVVGQELDARRSEAAARLANPRIVVQRVDDAGLAGVGIDGDVPAVLVVGRARARDRSLPSSDTSGIDQRISRSAFLPGACDGRLPSASVRSALAAVGCGSSPAARSCRRPDGLAGLEVEHGEERSVLRVAHRGAAGMSSV